MATYDLSDDSVVIVIGSGAGGGTLANELCQKGVPVVLLEAGKRVENSDFINDEWTSFLQLAWLDKRTTSGSWRVAKDFPNLPAWICKTVGGTTTHWAGASLRIQPHEFRVKSEYGEIAGANLLDWPLSYEELEPYYAKAEDKLGVTRTHDIPGLPGNNNFKVMYNGATRIGYQQVHTGRMAINSRPRHDRSACLQLGFCFQGCKSGAKWSTLYTEIPAAEATGKLDLRPQSMVLQIQHDDAGAVTGVLYADAEGNQQVQKGRAVCVACNSIETPRLLLNSASAKFPDGLANSSGQVGRNYMRHTTGSVYAIFDQPVRMYRGTTMAGIIQDEAKQRPEPRLRRRLRARDAGTRPAVHGGVPRARRLGPRLRLGDGELRPHGGHVDRRRGHAAGAERRNSAREREGRLRPADPERAFRRPRQRRRDAQPRLQAGGCGLRGGRRQAGLRDAALSLDPQSRHLPAERQLPADGVCNKFGQTHDIKNLFISDGSQFTTGAAENPTLTIVTLAIRQADHIADQMSKGEI